MFCLACEQCSYLVPMTIFLQEGVNMPHISGHNVIGFFLTLQFGIAIWGWLALARPLDSVCREIEYFLENVSEGLRLDADTLADGDALFENSRFLRECWE